MRKVRSGIDWNQPFPTIGHQQCWSHWIGFCADQNLWFDRIPAQSLLAARHGALDSVQVICVSHLSLGRQIGENTRAPRQQQESQKRQKPFQHARSVANGENVVKMDFTRHFRQAFAFDRGLKDY